MGYFFEYKEKNYNIYKKYVTIIIEERNLIILKILIIKGDMINEK